MYTRIRQKYAMEEGLVPIVLTSKPPPWELGGGAVSSHVVIIEAASVEREVGVLRYRCRRVFSKRNLVGFCGFAIGVSSMGGWRCLHVQNY